MPHQKGNEGRQGYNYEEWASVSAVERRLAADALCSQVTSGVLASSFVSSVALMLLWMYNCNRLAYRVLADRVVERILHSWTSK